MNYAEMTDFEINKKVCDFFWPSLSKSNFCENKNFEQGGSAVYIKNGYGGFSRDYCNSWSDAGPIIEKHMICLAADVFAEPQDGGKWVAQPAYGWDSERVRSDNPLRAAMILFLQAREKANA